MPILQIARLVGEHDTRLWRIIQKYVSQAREAADYSAVRHVGVDETATKRGHNYVTLFVDMEQAKVIYATEGKDAATLKVLKIRCRSIKPSLHKSPTSAPICRLLSAKVSRRIFLAPA